MRIASQVIQPLAMRLPDGDAWPPPGRGSVLGVECVADPVIPPRDQVLPALAHLAGLEVVEVDCGHSASARHRVGWRPFEQDVVHPLFDRRLDVGVGSM